MHNIQVGNAGLMLPIDVLPSKTPPSGSRRRPVSLVWIWLLLQCKWWNGSVLQPTRPCGRPSTTTLQRLHLGSGYIMPGPLGCSDHSLDECIRCSRSLLRKPRPLSRLPERLHAHTRRGRQSCLRSGPEHLSKSERLGPAFSLCISTSPSRSNEDSSGTDKAPQGLEKRF